MRLRKRIRDYFWWKAYRWVFFTKRENAPNGYKGGTDCRWMHINDLMQEKWREDHLAEYRNGPKEENEKIP